MEEFVRYYSEMFPLFRKHGEEDAGFDLPTKEDFTIKPGELKVVPTGIYLDIPSGLYGQILGRSGLAAKGIVILGGVIDPGYRGEVKVVMYNAGQEELFFEAGDRIAQIVFIKIYNAPVVLVSSKNRLSHSVRGTGGFGSTD